MQTNEWMDARIALIGRDHIIETTPEELMKELNIHLSDAYSLRRRATAEAESEGASESLSHRILQVLKTGPKKDVAELRQALFFQHGDLEASPMDVSKAIWSLQKRSLVTFYERKQGKDSLLTRIKLTRNGLQEMGVVPTPEFLRPAMVKPSRELKRPSKVGKDMTDEEQHGQKAKGGPVEILRNTIQNGEIKPVRLNGDPPRQNEKPQPIVRVHAVNFDDFPIIKDLMGKEDRLEKYEAAAALLEDMEQEIALSLLEKIQLTDLEKEVIRFVRAATS